MINLKCFIGIHDWEYYYNPRINEAERIKIIRKHDGVFKCKKCKSCRQVRYLYYAPELITGKWIKYKDKTEHYFDDWIKND